LKVTVVALSDGAVMYCRFISEPRGRQGMTKSQDGLCVLLTFKEGVWCQQGLPCRLTLRRPGRYGTYATQVSKVLRRGSVCVLGQKHLYFKLVEVFCLIVAGHCANCTSANAP